MVSEEPMSKDAELLGYCEKMINGFPTEWEGAVLVAHAFKALKQENAELRQQLAFAKAFADPPDIKTGQTVRDELKAENERTNAKIAKYQALVRYWIPCTAERKIAEIEST